MFVPSQWALLAECKYRYFGETNICLDPNSQEHNVWVAYSPRIPGTRVGANDLEKALNATLYPYPLRTVYRRSVLCVHYLLHSPTFPLIHRFYAQLWSLLTRTFIIPIVVYFSSHQSARLEATVAIVLPYRPLA